MAMQENISPAVIRKVATELRKLMETPLDGIKVIPNESDVTDVQAIVEGPVDTPYQGGAFRVKLKLGAEFPAAPPKGFFLTKIFHPNVAKNGEICVNTLKRDWKEDLGIGHILLTIKCLLIDPNPESALNEEAGKLLLEAYDEYAKHARLWTNIHAQKELANLKASSNSSSSSKDRPTSPVAATTTTTTPTAASGANSSNQVSTQTPVNATTTTTGSAPHTGVNTNGASTSARVATQAKTRHANKESTAAATTGGGSTSAKRSAPVEQKKKSLKRL